MNSTNVIPGGLLVKREWQNVTMINADCLDCLPIEADAVISDPPYGMDWPADSKRFVGGAKESKAKRGNGGATREKIIGDDQPFEPQPWLGYPICVLWGSNHYGQRLPVGTTLVWIKRSDHAFGTFLSDAEIAWMKGGHGVYCKRDFGMKAIASKQCHPNQKPVSLMAWCMDMAKVPVGATVLDPYAGSASTCIACIRTGRKFIGIEKDPKHYQTACERIEQELAQGVLFSAYKEVEK